MGASIQKPGLLQRLYWAVKAFQMRFTGYGGSTGQSWNGIWPIEFFPNSRINYAREAGRLTQSSLVMSAVNWLGRTLPEAPLQIMQSDSAGKEKPVVAHPAVELLKRPNPFYCGANLWKAFAVSWITSGNVYFFKARNSFGRIAELWHIPSFMIGPRWPEDGSEFISYYEYQTDGAIARIDVDDVIHFRDGADPDNMGRTGLSPVASVLREVCADNEVAAYQFLILKNSGVPPVVISLKEGVGAVKFDASAFKQEYMARTTGDRRGEPFVSTRAIELTKLGFNPEELQMKVLRHLPESRFASVIGIAKETLGFGAADENSTYNNVTEADRRSIQTYVRPLWSYVEDELTHQLGPDFGLKAGQRFDFDLSEVAALQEDQNELHKRANADLTSGGILVNEYREMIGLEPRDDGNVYLRPTSVQAVTPEMQAIAIESAMVSNQRLIENDPNDPANQQNTDPGEDPPRSQLVN